MDHTDGRFRLRSAFNLLLPLVLCMVVGLLIATLPHVFAWRSSGHADWVADHDDRYYLAVASQAYFDHPARLADPLRASDGPSLYKPLPLLPGVMLARLLDLGPLAIGLIWRAMAGLTIGAAWFLLFWILLRKPWLAAALALVLLCDGGVIERLPVLPQTKIAAKVALGRDNGMFEGRPFLHPEWRVSTPGLTMPYLLAFVAGLACFAELPTRKRAVVLGVTFGLLFHVYFYYWTAAGFALAMLALIDRRRFSFYLIAMTIGGAIGLPSLLPDFALKQRTGSDWLTRSDKFVTIGRFDELLVSPEVVVVFVVLLVWILFRRRQLLGVWLLGAAGFVLTNQQIITRLQIENFHWTYVSGPVLAFLLVMLVATELQTFAQRFQMQTWAAVALGGLVLLNASTGLWLRWQEAARTQTSRDNAVALEDYRERLQQSGSIRLAPNTGVAGDPTFVSFATIIENTRPLSGYIALLSPTVSNDEWDERVALDGILTGFSRPQFAEIERESLAVNRWGPWVRDPVLFEERVDARMRAFDRVRGDVSAFLDRFGVRYVALPTRNDSRHLGAGWARVESGRTWNIWERVGKPSEEKLSP